MKKNQLYYVVFRMGGTENATWHRTVAAVKAEAEKMAEAIRKGGRKALVIDKELSDKIGLPEGYEYTK